MRMSESSAGLTLADFLYSRLSPISKYNVESDYHRHNPPAGQTQHHNNSRKPPTQSLRGPKFIVGDVRRGETKSGKQVSRAVSSFRAALNNIVDIKESLFRTLLPPRPRGRRPYEGVGTDQGSEDIAIVGGSDWEQFSAQNNYFRPSLTDPLRPAVKIISPVPGGSSATPTQFSPPRERTPISMAVVGQQVRPRRPENVEQIKTESYTGGNLVPLQHPVEKIKGRLKVPEERTLINTAVFAGDIFHNKPLQTRTLEPFTTSQTQTETLQSSRVILGGDKSQEFVRVRLLLSHPNSVFTSGSPDCVMTHPSFLTRQTKTLGS